MDLSMFEKSQPMAVVICILGPKSNTPLIAGSALPRINSIGCVVAVAYQTVSLCK